MAATKYTKSASADFTGLTESIPDLAALTSELQSSAIVTALDYINMAGDTVDIWFKDALSAGDQTALTTVCNNHTGVPLPDDQVSTVEIQEEKIPTAGGHFQFKGIDIDIDAGTAGDETSVEVSWPYPINIIDAQLIFESEHKGDYLKSEVAPDTTVGAITAAVAADDTVITVDNTFRDNLAVGYMMKLTDGTNTDSLGRVISIDGNDVTVETAAVNAFAVATPTYVKMTAMHVPHMRLPGAGQLSVGAANLTSSYLPANKVIKITYTNNDTAAKTFNVYLEYKY